MDSNLVIVSDFFTLSKLLANAACESIDATIILHRLYILELYVDFFNNHRPCYAVGYDTPVNHRKRFNKGELEQKNIFRVHFS